MRRNRRDTARSIQPDDRGHLHADKRTAADRAGRDALAHPYAASVADSVQHADFHDDAHADGYAHSHAFAKRDCHRDIVAIADAVLPDADTDAYVAADVDADIHSHTVCYAGAHGHADADADANADRDGDGDANANRDAGNAAMTAHAVASERTLDEPDSTDQEAV